MNDIGSMEPRLSVEKVQRIAKNDPEYMETDDDAFIATAYATELFVQSLAAESVLISNFSDNGINDDINLTYNDISDCVVMKGNFQFLMDMVPRNKNLKELVMENKVRYTTSAMPDELIEPQQDQLEMQHRPSQQSQVPHQLNQLQQVQLQQQAQQQPQQQLEPPKINTNANDIVQIDISDDTDDE